jgi:Flp pilus assembly protein TadG
MKRRRPSAKSGNAALELALTVLMLWGLLSGAFRYGYSMYIYESLVTAVAGAARYGARVDFDAKTHSFVAAVKNMAVYGSPITGQVPLAPHLTVDNIDVTWTSDATGVPRTMTLKVINYSVNAVFQSFTWSGKPSVTVRFAGRYLT